MKQLFTILGLTCITLLSAQNNLPAGGGEAPVIGHDEMSPAQYQEIKTMLHDNIEFLKSEGKIPLTQSKTESVAFQFPLDWNTGFSGYNFYGISNFVDHNPAYPGFLLDWNCGARTYDTEAGYNHAGIDYFLWPFSWDLMENSAVKIVAAAPGLIVGKTNGAFDKSCDFNNLTWNAIYVRHADGSTAWYGHMKNGSLTDKGLGDNVEAGEFLGVVGSSGNSTGPHLHFEVYDADDNLIDTYAGTCNDFNAESWWAVQPAYNVPEINRIQTHDYYPDFKICPEVEDIHAKDAFMAGENLIVAFYAKDLGPTDNCHLTIEKPDGANWQDWNFVQTEFYVASYWIWTYTLPANAEDGFWKFTCTVAGNYYEHQFLVGELPAEIHNLSSINSAFVNTNSNSVDAHINANTSFNSKVSIINSNGQLISTVEAEIIYGENTIHVPLENVATGIYVLNITDKNSGVVKSIKFLQN